MGVLVVMVVVVKNVRTIQVSVVLVLFSNLSMKRNQFRYSFKQYDLRYDFHKYLASVCKLQIGTQCILLVYFLVECITFTAKAKEESLNFLPAKENHEVYSGGDGESSSSSSSWRLTVVVMLQQQ